MFAITDFLQFVETAFVISMVSFVSFLYIKTRDELVKKNLMVLTPIAFLLGILYIYDYFSTHYVLMMPNRTFDLEYTYALFSMLVVAAVTVIVGMLTRFGIQLFPINSYIKKITYRAVLSFIVVIFVMTIIIFMFLFGNDLVGAIGAAINYYYPLTSLGVFIIAAILVFQYRSIVNPYHKRDARIYLIAFLPQIAFTLFDVLLLRNYYLQLTHLSYTTFAILSFYNMSSHVFLNYEQDVMQGVTKSAGISNLGLTEREIEVMDYLVQGLINKEVALELNISENTVKTHIKSIYRKLEVSNRLQMIHVLKNQEKANHPRR